MVLPLRTARIGESGGKPRRYRYLTWRGDYCRALWKSRMGRERSPPPCNFTTGLMFRLWLYGTDTETWSLLAGAEFSTTPPAFGAT
jgi:hypothetical protein